MNERTNFYDERLDDIPVLLAQLERMQVGALLDRHFPTHGNWQGLSLVQVVQVWLCFILSESNHRLSHVQPWVEQRLQSLQALVNPTLRALDFSDDRLASVLDCLGSETGWTAFEAELGRDTIRVYDLSTERVRIDSTTAIGYRAVSEAGLFQFGHSKDHRPDLPQLKVNVAALDPLGLPLSTTVVAGQTADDPLYLPEMARIQPLLARREVTYVGDVKMAALATRAFVAAHGDHYLCPLPAVQRPDEALDRLLEPVWAGQQSLVAIKREGTRVHEPETIAEGFEVPMALEAEPPDGFLQWNERRLVIRSVSAAQSACNALHERLAKAREAIEALGSRGRGKPVLTDPVQVQEHVAKIMARYRVEGLLEVSLQTARQARHVRGYAGNAARLQIDEHVVIAARVNDFALKVAERRLGWRVYATNAPAQQISLEEAVRAYRQAYHIEHDFARLKGKPLALTPLYLNSDRRVTGLVRLLTIGLRVLTLVEFVARRALANRAEPPLQDLYPGNLERATARPTTELLLRAFKAITLIVMTQGDLRIVHVTPLSDRQHRILRLLDLPADLFEDLGHRISDTLFKMSEP
jgi:transposase